MKKNIIQIAFCLFISSCGNTEGFKFEIIRNKKFSLDSVVLFKEGQRIFKYDSIEKFIVKKDTIIFGDNDSLRMQTVFDTAFYKADSVYKKDEKMQYYLKNDSIYLVKRTKISRLSILFNKDTTQMEIHDVDKNHNSMIKRYYSKW